MPRIESIHLHIQTGKLSRAGTNGDVYLGLCGREFHIDSKANDFEAGSARVYVFGTSATVLDAAVNDPREPNAVHRERCELPGLHPVPA